MGEPHRSDSRPLVMHVVYRFAVGGLENGLVNLVNRLPAGEFRHAIVSLTDCDPHFAARLVRDDIDLISLHKPPGHGYRVFGAIWRLIRERRPSIVHTRNLAALEMQLPAFAAGVRVRLHGEHGRDAADPEGLSRRYRLLRRALSPFVTHYVAVSNDLSHYLIDAVGIAAGRVSCIVNGVDDVTFFPAASHAEQPGAAPGDPAEIVIGTVGRLDAVKGHDVLVAAVAGLLEHEPQLRGRLKVEIVGEGPMRDALTRLIAERGLTEIIRLPGECADVAERLRRFDLFVLPSHGEGISNTLLEAMATGLPIVATRVGGNPELVTEGRTGQLVPPADPGALAAAIRCYVADAAMRRAHGRAGRAAVEERFSLAGMVARYAELYSAVLAGRQPPLPAPAP